MFVTQGATAQDGVVVASTWGWGIGAGLAIGLAALGGTLGQANAAKGFYESVSRNPQVADKIQTSFFVGLAFIESLVIFAFAIAFLLQLGR